MLFSIFTRRKSIMGSRRGETEAVAGLVSLGQMRLGARHRPPFQSGCGVTVVTDSCRAFQLPSHGPC
jgi:hypothetical protein